jgi:hypothetical protein
MRGRHCRFQAPFPLCIPIRWHGASKVQSEKDAKLAQKLGQLQPFTAAVFPQECMGQLASSGPA